MHNIAVPIMGFVNSIPTDLPSKVLVGILSFTNPKYFEPSRIYFITKAKNDIINKKFKNQRCCVIKGIRRSTEEKIVKLLENDLIISEPLA